MRVDLFGFNQEKALEYNLAVEDLLLIDYIWDMIASPTMQHLIDDGVPYVWLQHDRILADLPILNISNRSLINYLNKLKDLGLLTVKTVHCEGLRGSRSYYAITEKCEELRYDEVQKIAVSQRPGAKNCSSDNISNNNKTKQQELFTDNINKEELEVRKREELGQKFVADYNSICKSLPKCQRITPKRTKAISNLLKKYSYDDILMVFEKLEASDFCSGRSTDWRADIDFILREDKFLSVLEGKYDNRKRRCNVETISGGDKKQISSEERERIIKNGKKF